LSDCTAPKSEKPSEWLWQICFGQEKAILNVEGFWRLIVNERVAFACDDDGQKFGLPAPLNGTAWCNEALQHKQVVAFEFRANVSDLAVVFEDGSRLELFNSSCGYEGWSYHVKNGQTIRALGGGDVAIF
jgi:hypothetical protein